MNERNRRAPTRIPPGMEEVREIFRRTSPAQRPQPLAMHAGRLWMGSWETDRLYAIDPQSWKIVAEVAAPGKPYGLAAYGGALWAVVSLGDDDDRYLMRFSSESGFDDSSRVACPDFTGSHLAADADALYLCQQGKGRILAIDAGAHVRREILLPTRCAGLGFGAGGALYIISGDEELENLKFAAFDLTAETPQADALATIPFDARSLAFDGTNWWTSHREAGEIVSFAV